MNSFGTEVAARPQVAPLNTKLDGRYGLTDDQLAQFWRDGFVYPVTLYTPEEMKRLWREVRIALADRSHAAYPTDNLTDGFGGVTNISNYDRHLDVEALARHITHPEIIGKVASILGPDIMTWRTEFFPKQPGDEGTDWHQADTFANASGKPQILWPGETESHFGKGTITVWTAFTDVTIKNGCLQVIPGTHNKMNYDESRGMKYKAEEINALEKDGRKRGFYGYDYRELQIDPNFKADEGKAVSLEMKAGQCVIFWSTLMHASHPNSNPPGSTDVRIGYAARYVPSTVDVYPGYNVVTEFGGEIRLDNFGCVIVSGANKNPRNRIVTATRRGYSFVHYAP